MRVAEKFYDDVIISATADFFLPLGPKHCKKFVDIKEDC